MKRRGLAKGLLATAALAFTIAAAPVSSVRAEAAQGTYTVEKGDCLWKIAKKVYGNERLWKVIYDANTGIVRSNYMIYQGQTLVIPEVNGNSAPAPAAGTPAPQTPAPQTPAPQTPAPQTPAPQTPAPQTPAPEASASAQDQEFTLDYNQLASWIYSGFVGTSTTGEKVILALDAESDYGILIFADDSNMTAASFVGPVTYNKEYMTISDETNGLAMTFAVKEIGDGTLSLDMGDLGTATVNVQVREVVLDSVKKVIEGYKHVA